MIGADGAAVGSATAGGSAGEPDAVLRNEFAAVEVRIVRESGRNVLRVHDAESGAVADLDPFLLSRLALTLADDGQDAVELVTDIVWHGIPGNGGERRRVGRFMRNERARRKGGGPRQKGDPIGYGT